MLIDDPSIPLILASRSPRRKELLVAAGYVFRVLPPEDDAEDARRNSESPEEYVRRLCVQKARNVAGRIPKGLIVGCDTIAVCGNEILGKPFDRDDARRMLCLLQGRKHAVLSGICLLKKPGEDRPERLLVDSVRTELIMQSMTNDSLDDYLDSGNWQGKAGAFGYQDHNDWIDIVRGSESNVVGLPMERFRTMLDEMEADRNSIQNTTTDARSS